MRWVFAVPLVVACSGSGTKAPATASGKPTRVLDFMGNHVGDSLHQPGINCLGLTGHEITCPVDPKPKIGDVHVTRAEMAYLDRKLYQWELSADVSDYDALVRALTAKYGVPDSSADTVDNSRSTEIPSGEAGPMTFSYRLWKFADGELSATRGLWENGNGTSNITAVGTKGRDEYQRRVAAAQDAEKSQATAAILKDLNGKQPQK